MKNILIPCDFSKPSVNAFRFAVDMAKPLNATVHLIHAIELPIMTMPAFNFEKTYITELRDNSEKEFKKLREQYRTEAEGVVFIYSLELGSPSTTILNYVAKTPIDLIIMGSHGTSGLSEIFIGSNAEKIVRKSPVPVLVVKNHFKRDIKNIVFPNTLEMENQEELLMKVKALQDIFHAKLHVVFINTPGNFINDTETYQHLDAFAKRFMLKNFTLNIYSHSDEEEGILQFAKRIDADLIAMGTHSRNGISHLVSGSVTEDVTNHTDTLIWTYSLKNQLIEI